MDGLAGVVDTALASPGEAMPNAMGVNASTTRPDVEPEPTPDRSAHVKKILKKIQLAKAHFKPDFDRMHQDQSLAWGDGQWPAQGLDDDRYTANLVQSYLRDSVSSLYARNPTADAKPRETIDFKLWDGEQASLMLCMQTMQSTQQMLATGQPLDPMHEQAIQSAQAVLQDVQQGVARRKQLQGLGKTMKLMFKYELSQQLPSFKQEMKQLVWRTKVNNIGWVKLGFKRSGERRPEVTSQLMDMTEQMATIDRLREEIAEGELDPYDAEYDQLKSAIAALQEQPDIITREGLDFSFPDSTKVIVDPMCKRLKGLVGAHWLAEEHMLSPASIKEIWGKDIGKEFTAYNNNGTVDATGNVWREDDQNSLACVYEFYDKRDGALYVVCIGHNDFLCEPAAPYLKLPRFFPYYQLVFNMGENEKKLYPWSDVRNLRHIQREYNRSKEGLRQHRIANRPLYATPTGALDDEDAKNLGSYEAHSVIELSTFKEGQKTTDILAPVGKVPIDPNVYETKNQLTDMQLVGGSQGANLGGPTGVTATESSIAQGAKMSSAESNVDDLDELLSEIAHDAGQVMLMEISAETVTEIVGPGAIWPVLTPEQIAKDISLVIKAGSTGRPNAGADQAKLEKLIPLLIQTPGINPMWLARKMVETFDANVDLTDAVIEGLPSIISMNQAQQPQPGDPASQPNAQGPQGAVNGPKGAQPSGPPQGMLPAPHAATPAGPAGGPPAVH